MSLETLITCQQWPWITWPVVKHIPWDEYQWPRLEFLLRFADYSESVGFNSSEATWLLIISAGVLVYYKLDNISFGHLFCFANGPLHRMDLFHLANLKCTLYLASMVIVCRTFSTDPGRQSYQFMSNFFPQIAFISSRIRCRRKYPHIPPYQLDFDWGSVPSHTIIRMKLVATRSWCFRSTQGD